VTAVAETGVGDLDHSAIAGVDPHSVSIGDIRVSLAAHFDLRGGDCLSDLVVDLMT
jgi:hypothetical protein